MIIAYFGEVPQLIRRISNSFSVSGTCNVTKFYEKTAIPPLRLTYAAHWIYNTDTKLWIKKRDGNTEPMSDEDTLYYILKAKKI